MPGKKSAPPALVARPAVRGVRRSSQEIARPRGRKDAERWAARACHAGRLHEVRGHEDEIVGSPIQAQGANKTETHGPTNERRLLWRPYSTLAHLEEHPELAAIHERRGRAHPQIEHLRQSAAERSRAQQVTDAKRSGHPPAAAAWAHAAAALPVQHTRDEDARRHGQTRRPRRFAATTGDSSRTKLPSCGPGPSAPLTPRKLGNPTPPPPVTLEPRQTKPNAKVRQPTSPTRARGRRRASHAQPPHNPPSGLVACMQRPRQERRGPSTKG